MLILVNLCMIVITLLTHSNTQTLVQDSDCLSKCRASSFITWFLRFVNPIIVNVDILNATEWNSILLTCMDANFCTTVFNTCFWTYLLLVCIQYLISSSGNHLYFILLNKVEKATMLIFLKQSKYAEHI